MVAPSVDNDLGFKVGKRQHNVHIEPKSTTYQAQIEYLDKIALKY